MVNKKVISENQRELKKKLKKKKLQGESLAKDLLWKQLQLLNFQNTFSVSRSLCFILLLPELAPAETVARPFRSFYFFCHPDKEEKNTSRCWWIPKKKLETRKYENIR